MRPPATRRVYSNEGYAVLGALLGRDNGMGHAEYVHGAVFAPLGMDAFLGLPESESGRALDVREPGLWRAGTAALQLACVERSGRRLRAARLRRAPPTPPSCRLLLQRGAPLIAAETFDEFARVQYPGLPGGIESFVTWERADWGLGLRHPRRQGAALDGDAHLGRDACRTSAPPARSCGPISTRAWASSASPTAAPIPAG